MIEEMGGDFLQWLRGFYFVAKKGSVTLASQEMGRNQPTISHQIKCLETEFGVTFFDRSSGKMELTPEGRVFLGKTISLFEVIKEMKSDIGEDRLPQEGKVVIATTHAISSYFLPPFVVRYRKEYPGVNFEIEGGGLNVILEKLELAEADFGIANLDSVPKTLAYHELFETRLKLIAQKNNPFFSKKGPTLEKIAEAPFISFPRSSTIAPLIERKFSGEGLGLNVVMVLNNYLDVKKYVGLGVGVSILDDYTLTEEDKKSLDIFSVEQFFDKREYGLILRKRKYISPVVKAFIRGIKPGISFE